MLRVFILSSLVLLTPGDGVMVGAPRKIEASMESFGDKLAKITHKFNSKHGNHSLHIITKLINATSQVVSGIFYTFYVRFSPTSCTTLTDDNNHVLNDVTANPNSCNSVDGKSQICKATVWQRPWLQLNNSEIVSIVSCSMDTS
ncbi:unnamed protein product [Schistosoma turkestanicum]|nr:unnamed protein product [Schistosoma turkestanicum]